MSDLVGISILVFNLALALVYFYAFGSFLSALKENHRNDWDEMGEPNLFLNNSFENMSKAISYILRKEFRASPSKKVVKLGALSRLFFFLCFFSLLVSLLIVLWSDVVR
jgi:hypothetical protein